MRIAIASGKSHDIGFVHGKLIIGQTMSPPLIRTISDTREISNNSMDNRKARLVETGEKA